MQLRHKINSTTAKILFFANKNTKNSYFSQKLRFPGKLSHAIPGTFPYFDQYHSYLFRRSNAKLDVYSYLNNLLKKTFKRLIATFYFLILPGLYIPYLAIQNSALKPSFQLIFFPSS